MRFAISREAGRKHTRSVDSKPDEFPINRESVVKR